MAAKAKRRKKKERMTAYEALLELLTQAPEGKRVTSTDVNELVGEKLSRQATRKASMRLQRQGYIVTGNSGRRGGYELLGKNDE